jgi:hypothetical protein
MGLRRSERLLLRADCWVLGVKGDGFRIMHATLRDPGQADGAKSRELQTRQFTASIMLE